MTTTAPIVPAPAAPTPTTAPAIVVVVPPPPAPAPVPPPAPPAPAAPAVASRRSVLLLAAVVGCLAVAGLLYALVDRPGLREPLEVAAHGFDHFLRQRLFTSFDIGIRSTASRIVTSFEGTC